MNILIQRSTITPISSVATVNIIKAVVVRVYWMAPQDMMCPFDDSKAFMQAKNVTVVIPTHRILCESRVKVFSET